MSNMEDVSLYCFGLNGSQGCTVIDHYFGNNPGAHGGVGITGVPPPPCLVPNTVNDIYYYVHQGGASQIVPSFDLDTWFDSSSCTGTIDCELYDDDESSAITPSQISFDGTGS